MRASLDRRECFDVWPDLGLGACARIAGLETLSFGMYAAFGINLPRAAFGYPVGFRNRAPSGFSGPIVSWHKTDTKQALCIAGNIGTDEQRGVGRSGRLPECDPNCVHELRDDRVYGHRE